MIVPEPGGGNRGGGYLPPLGQAGLGILLQRGNVALLGNRVPAFPGPAIDGIE